MIENVNRPGFVELWTDGKLKQIAFEDGWIINFDDEMNVHCDEGPAIVKPDGTLLYYCKNQLHNYAGPAVFRPSGENENWVNNERFEK